LHYGGKERGLEKYVIYLLVKFLPGDSPGLITLPKSQFRDPGDP
jgi:hypothetical protein